MDAVMRAIELWRYAKRKFKQINTKQSWRFAMAKYIYEVQLKYGSNNPSFGVFLDNVIELNAKSPDYDGIKNVCIISHHMDKETVRVLCGDGLGKNKANLTVTEITKESLELAQGHHRIYRELIESYFLAYGDYPNIK